MKESQLLIGGQLLYGHANFSPDRHHHDGPGSDGGNAIGLLPGLSAFGTYKVNQDLTLGFGMCSNFGLGLWYDSNWVGRYYAKEAILMGMSFLPAAAYRVTDQFSVGVGPECHARLSEKSMAINNIDPRWPDGELYLKDTTVGVGANVGLMYELTKGTRFGVTYNSPVKLNFSATPEFTTTAPGLSAILLNRGTYFKQARPGGDGAAGGDGEFLPRTQRPVGTARQLRLAELVPVRQDRCFGLHDCGGALTTNLKYNDTWHGALGAQYRLSEPWLLTGGVAYDSSMLDDVEPVAGAAAGLVVAVRHRGPVRDAQGPQLGFAYEYLYGGNPAISQVRASSPCHPAGRHLFTGATRTVPSSFSAPT